MGFSTDSLRDDQAYAESWQKVHAAIENGASLEAIAAIAPDFPARVAQRLQPLHQSLRGLGLTAPDLADHGQKLLAVTDTYVRLQFADRSAEGREIVLDVTRNGNAFLSGRRYESGLSRVSLSDAEISATNILRLDINRDEGLLVVTFMTFDARPARIVFNPAQPIDPLVEGTIPTSALASLRRSGNGGGLRPLIRIAVEATEREGAANGFWRRMVNRQVRRAHADRRSLEALAASIDSGSLTGDAWWRTPAAIGRTIDILLGRLSEEEAGGQFLAIRALVAIGVNRLLSEIDSDA